MSLFGLIARPEAVGGEVLDDEADEDEREEVDDEDEEDEDEGPDPELSCLIKSAARSAYPRQSNILIMHTWNGGREGGTYQTIEDRHEMRRDLEREDRAIDDPESVYAIHPVPRVDHPAEVFRHHGGCSDGVPVGSIVVFRPGSPLVK